MTNQTKAAFAPDEVMPIDGMPAEAEAGATWRAIRIDDELYRRLCQSRTMGEIPCDTIRRLLGLPLGPGGANRTAKQRTIQQ